jgi:hypothetical protein
MLELIFQNLIPTFILILFILLLIVATIFFIYYWKTYSNRIHIIEQEDNIDQIYDENIIYQNNI